MSEPKVGSNVPVVVGGTSPARESGPLFEGQRGYIRRRRPTSRHSFRGQQVESYPPRCAVSYFERSARPTGDVFRKPNVRAIKGPLRFDGTIHVGEGGSFLLSPAYRPQVPLLHRFATNTPDPPHPVIPLLFHPRCAISYDLMIPIHPFYRASGYFVFSQD
jgi:hypothetical protein